MSHLWRLMDFPLARLPQLSGEKAGLIRWFICTFPPPVMDGTSTFPWNFIISQLHSLSHGEACKRNETDTPHTPQQKKRKRNRLTREHNFSLRMGEFGNTTLSAPKPLNHSPTSGRSQILDGAQLQLVANGALIDSLIPSSGLGPLGSRSVFSFHSHVGRWEVTTPKPQSRLFVSVLGKKTEKPSQDLTKMTYCLIRMFSDLPQDFR